MKSTLEQTATIRNLKGLLLDMTAERDAAIKALSVVMLDPETQSWLKDNKPQSLIQCAHAVRISAMPALSDETARAIKALSQVVRALRA